MVVTGYGVAKTGQKYWLVKNRYIPIERIRAHTWLELLIITPVLNNYKAIAFCMSRS